MTRPGHGYYNNNGVQFFGSRCTLPASHNPRCEAVPSDLDRTFQD